MSAKLIAFSIIYVAPPTFQTPYVVGIAETDGRNRVPVRIEGQFMGTLRLGLEGKIEEKTADVGKLSYFMPV
jgi:uncharacterized OB-fold protein